MDYMEFLIGLVSGVAVTLIIIKIISGKKAVDSEGWIQQKEAMEKEKSMLIADKTAAEVLLKSKREELATKETKITELDREVKSLSIENATYKADKENLENDKKELKEIREKFNTEFSLLAGKILKQNTEEFSNTNEKRLSEILHPFKEQIKAFEEKVDQTYRNEFREKASLKEEIGQLVKLNTRLSEQAQDLTKALKGDSKQQGNWGEMVLERILESSGLVKGESYKTQDSIEIEGGKTGRPDAVVYLPDNKHLIIDAKVSLVAYERMVNANNEDERQQQAKQHILSVKNHIKELSEKRYHGSTDLNSPQFTLLFIPIEASFSVALREDAELFNFAWKNKIVIVSPTTLLATLMTISSMWKQELQTKNVLEIARQGGDLYDKFYGFLTDMESIGKNIDRTKDAYDSALNKIKTGKGNLISRAERIKKLGANTKKTISDKWLDDEALQLTNTEKENE